MPNLKKGKKEVTPLRHPLYPLLGCHDNTYLLHILFICFPFHHWPCRPFAFWCLPMVKPNQYMSLGWCLLLKIHWAILIKVNISCFFWNFASRDSTGPELSASYNSLGFSTWWSFPWSPGYPGGHCFHKAPSLLPGTCLRTLELESFLSTYNASERIHLSMPLTLLSVDYSRPGTGMHTWLHWSLPRWPPLAEVLVVSNTVVLRR